MGVNADEIFATLGSGSADTLELEKTKARRLVADGGLGLRDRLDWRAGNQFTGRSVTGFEV